MSKDINSSEKIGEIAARFPKSMDVFKDYGIDFCCGGNRPLKEAIDEKKIDEAELLGKLNEEMKNIDELVNKTRDWNNESYSEIIDYVVNNHHSYTMRTMPEVEQLTAKILRAHGENHGEELRKVHKLFNSLKCELEEHLIKEEEVVFPLIKNYEKAKNANLEEAEELRAKAVTIIRELEAEHEGAGAILKELREVTNNYSVPKDGCNTYRYTFQKLEELEGDLFKHIHLENNIMFPRIGA